MSTSLETQHEILVGVLERILFFNEESHYCIGELKAERPSQTIVITGALPGVQCGETLSLLGNWVQHPTHGRQFKVASFESKLPATVYGIRQYLGSGLIPGVGKVYAEKIVNAFGENTLTVISEESARLRNIPGIGKERAKAIKKAWDDQQALREVMLFLKTYGVGTALCLRLVKNYGANAITVLRNDPYRVAREIHGIGFKTADRIALNLGMPTNSPNRLDAGILFTLMEFESQGHTCREREILKTTSAERLEVDAALIEERLTALIEGKELFALPWENYVQRPQLKSAECRITQSIREIAQTSSVLPPIIIDKAIDWAQQRAGFDFAPEQKMALEASLSNKLSVITGGPGTGKTTILRALVDILKAKKVRICLAAPTGRAAQRMTETTGAYAQTIHRLLKFDPAMHSFTANYANTLKGDVFIVDESSMLDSMLAASLFEAIPRAAHLILVGDVFQLPSIGPGNVLQDIIRSETFAVTRLNQIFRQKGRNDIVLTAHAILNGEVSLPRAHATLDSIIPKNDLFFIKALTPEACLETVTTLCKTTIPKYFPKSTQDDIQVLAPLHRGTAGIANFNYILQRSLNTKNTASLLQFKVGDKLIQTRNNYDKGIFNGDLGKVTAIDPQAQTLTAQFDGLEVVFERADLSDLALAYTISIHKSQGSEYPLVIIPLLKQHFVMLERSLLYTAITRARRKVFIVGDPAAYAMAVQNQKNNYRQTALYQQLINH